MLVMHGGVHRADQDRHHPGAESAAPQSPGQGFVVALRWVTPQPAQPGEEHRHQDGEAEQAERGLFGFAVLMTVLLAWLRWLWRYRPKSDDESLAWALWGGALSAWVVTVLIGTVNTTMHHEHAILSVLLLGMWLAYLRLNPREE